MAGLTPGAAAPLHMDVDSASLTRQQAEIKPDVASTHDDVTRAQSESSEVNVAEAKSTLASVDKQLQDEQ
jgi:hypothetical protein